MATKKTPASANLPAVKPANGVVSLASMAEIKAKLKEQLAGLADRTAPPSGAAVRITQDKKFKFPDGTESGGPFEAVIVDFVTTRDFYEGNFDPNNISPPACFAIGTIPKDMVPSPNAPAKQSDTCASCPQNQFGSAGNGKACKESRKLALLPADADGSTPIWTMKISPTALKSFDGYIATLGRQGDMPIEVVTEISFDSSSSYSSVRMANPVPNEALAVHFPRMAEAKEMLQAEPDVSTYGQTKAPAPRGRAPARGAARR